jgi:hypothetical protein
LFLLFLLLLRKIWLNNLVIKYRRHRFVSYNVREEEISHGNITNCLSKWCPNALGRLRVEVGNVRIQARSRCAGEVFCPFRELRIPERF